MNYIESLGACAGKTAVGLHENICVIKCAGSFNLQ